MPSTGWASALNAALTTIDKDLFAHINKRSRANTSPDMRFPIQPLSGRMCIKRSSEWSGMDDE